MHDAEYSGPLVGEWKLTIYVGPTGSWWSSVLYRPSQASFMSTMLMARRAGDLPSVLQPDVHWTEFLEHVTWAHSCPE